MGVEIDGRNVTGEYEEFSYSTPRLVYDTTVEGDSAVHRAVGPQGFMAVFTDPSDELRRLVGDGAVHEFVIRQDGQMLTERAALSRCVAGAPTRVVCCRPPAEDSPRWVADRQALQMPGLARL